MFRTLRCLGLVLVLALFLGAPSASASASREPEGLSVHGVLSALWETFTGFLGLSGPDTVLFMDTSSEGSGPGDPNGGPGMDPNGGPPKGP